MTHNPIRVVVGPANYFHIPEVSITCTIFSLMNNFLRGVDLRRTRHCCGTNQTAAWFELPGVKHILFRGHCSESDGNNWRRSPVTIAAW